MSENKDNSSSPNAQTTLELMKASQRWVVWKKVPGDKPGSKVKKIPYYVSGEPRAKGIMIDSPADIEQLATFKEAAECLVGGGYEGVGFALGYDPSLNKFWQGVDLDDMKFSGLGYLANRLPSYVEQSPSGNGVHCIGLGDRFKNIEPGTIKGLEAYSSGRFFTFTGRGVLRDEVPADLLSWNGDPGLRLEKAGVDTDPYNGSLWNIGDPTEYLESYRVEQLDYALPKYLDADERGFWINIAHGLRRYGDQGRELWDRWSVKSTKFNKVDQDKTWSSLNNVRSTVENVFVLLRENGCDLSELSKRGLSDKTDHDAPRQFNTDDEAEDQPKEYLINDFIRSGTFAFAGEPSGGKSTMLVSLAAIVAGLALNVDDSIKTFLHRRVLWFAEAPEQITDILKVMRENDRLVNDRHQVRDMIRVYYSRRGEPDYWSKQLPELLKGLEYENVLPDGSRYRAKPLVVFDTSSANFDIESENDNAEVSRLIANVRRVLLGYSAWLITHTAKVPRDASVFDLDNRGASAWKGDVEGTAVIGKERNPALREMRFLRFKKRRYAAPFDWIIGERELFQTEHKVLGAPGGVQISYVDTVRLRLVSERDGIEFVESVQEEAEERALDAREATVQEACQAAANGTRADGLEGLVLRVGRGGSPGPIPGYEKLKRVSVDDLRVGVCGIRSNQDRTWFKTVIEKLFEANGEIIAIRAQTFELGGG